MKNIIFTQIKQQFLSSVRLTIWLGSSLIVGLAGPFGTFTSLPLLPRLIYWTVLIGVSILFAVALREMLQTAGLRPGSSRFMAAMSLTFAAIYSPFVLTMTLLFDGDNPTQPGLGWLFLITLLVMVSVLGLRRMLGFDERRVEVRLLRRIPQKQGQAIARLAGEDHYVVIHFRDGSHERILMRLSDAIAETEPLRGVSVHRSHWVAETMIEGSERDRGREFLCLTDGTRIPVGKKFRPDLEKAGYL